MKLSIKRPGYAVYDDFLPERQWLELQHYIAHEARLSFINTVEHLEVWSIDDGHPLASPVVLTEVTAKNGQLSGKPLMRADDGPYFPYPTDTPIDFVLAKLLSMAQMLKPWIGRGGHDWKTLTGRAFIYPQNTSLDWHDDGGHYRAAFSYYLHQEWHARFGGELLIVTDSAGKRQQSMGGEFVIPMPNRLVVMSGGVPHKVARVTTSAGSNHRKAISGFFARAGAEQVSAGSVTRAVDLTKL